MGLGITLTSSPAISYTASSEPLAFGFSAKVVVSQPAGRVNGRLALTQLGSLKAGNARRVWRFRCSAHNGRKSRVGCDPRLLDAIGEGGAEPLAKRPDEGLADRLVVGDGHSVGRVPASEILNDRNDLLST
jgi:hypothetical protein